MSSHISEIIFNGKKELLEIINAGGDIIKHLAWEGGEICPLIGAEIKLSKTPIGKGAYGEVFEVTFPGATKNKKYVVKRAETEKDMFHYFKKTGERYRDIKFKAGTDASQILKLNNKNPDGLVPKEGVWLAVPTIEFLDGGCSKKKAYKRLDGKGLTIIPPNSFLCDEKYTEFAISVLVGDLYRKGASINFLDTFYFATCHEMIDNPRLEIPEIDVKRYTFMEKVDTTINKIKECLSADKGLRDGQGRRAGKEKIMNAVTIQILHAMAVYQRNFSIVHGDLHLHNIFIEYITPETKYKDQRLMEADFFEYKIGSKSVYIPADECPVLVKIGDWGLAVKYSEPMIGNESVMENGMDQHSLDDAGAWVPNFYSPAYDPVFVLSNLQTLNPTNEFIKNIAMWMYAGGGPRTKKQTFENLKRRVVSLSKCRIYRPRIEALTQILTHVTPEAILTDASLMGKYLKRPRTGAKIVVLGAA